MRIDYMTGDNPTNGFTYRGIVADQPPINNNNNHAAQFEFKGHWYHVYHNRIVAKQAGIPTGFRRNLAIEEFSFNDDGSIKKVTYTTNGVAQLGHLDPYVRVEGETFNAQSGVETEPCSEGGMNLTDLNNGDWVQNRRRGFRSQGRKEIQRPRRQRRSRGATSNCASAAWTASSSAPAKWRTLAAGRRGKPRLAKFPARPACRICI